MSQTTKFFLDRDKFRAAAMEEINTRLALPGAGNHRDFGGANLVEIARESLKHANAYSSSLNTGELVGRAMTTGDFPELLANSATKVLNEAFDQAEETWPIFCNVDFVKDFRTQTRVRASEVDGLELVPECGEYKYGSQSEAQESFSLATYGKIFSLTRQAIINDDLNALSDPARAHGEAAARKVGDVVFACITNNAAMGDGVALFHANHGNIGTSAAVGVGPIAEAIKLMKIQKDVKGLRALNIRPKFFLAPVELEGTSEQFFTTAIDPGRSISGVNNPYSGNYFTRVYEPRLDATSTTGWYLAAGKGKAITVFFLDGSNGKPYIERKEGFHTDSVEFKVRLDIGAKAMDWRGLMKNAGA